MGEPSFIQKQQSYKLNMGRPVLCFAILCACMRMQKCDVLDAQIQGGDGPYVWSPPGLCKYVGISQNVVTLLPRQVQVLCAGAGVKADLEDAVGGQENEAHDAANQRCQRVEGASNNGGDLHATKLLDFPCSDLGHWWIA